MHVRDPGATVRRDTIEEVAGMTGQRVQDVMTREVVVVAQDCGFKRIVDVLAESKVSAVPVVDASGTVVGIVSEADLLHKVEFRPDAPTPVFEGRARRESRAKATGQTARDIMSSPAITIDPSESIVMAARVMERNRVKRLPVVNAATGRLVGIVARRDLLRPYLRPDDEIKDDVATLVLRDSMWIDPAGIDIVVDDGRVVLRGRVDRRTTAAIAVRLVQALDGVVAVEDELAWDFDDVAVSRRRYMFEADVS
jgi:CBS domain-containing protein